MQTVSAFELSYSTAATFKRGTLKFEHLVLKTVAQPLHVSHGRLREAIEAQGVGSANFCPIVHCSVAPAVVYETIG